MQQRTAPGAALGIAVGCRSWALDEGWGTRVAEYWMRPLYCTSRTLGLDRRPELRSFVRLSAAHDLGFPLPDNLEPLVHVASANMAGRSFRLD